MTAKIIDGKAFAAGLRERVVQQVAELKSMHGLTPGLAVVLVGEDPASQVYVRNKAKFTREVGMESFEFRLPASVAMGEVLETVHALNHNPAVHGILVQLPLPKHLDENVVIDAIVPEKDVDGFHAVNRGRLAAGQDALVPCTPLGCLMMLQDHLGNLTGKHAVVIGRSNIVGKPMAMLLLGANCTVTIVHSRTVDLQALVRQADIVVAAVGKPRFVQAEWIKSGAVVIDVGINRIEEDGKSRLVGDVDFEAVKDVAGAITPVPGGVGPMTIACLLANTVQAACATHGVEGLS